MGGANGIDGSDLVEQGVALALQAIGHLLQVPVADDEPVAANLHLLALLLCHAPVLPCSEAVDAAGMLCRGRRHVAHASPLARCGLG